MSDLKSKWQHLEPLLDEILDLDRSQHAQWLARLNQSDPEAADALRELLEAEGSPPHHLLSEGAIPQNVQGSLVGQQLGAWHIEALLGRGGMGTVWLATRADGRFEGKAAVKLLNTSLIGQPAEHRFVREGSVLARLRHPGIAQLTDAGVTSWGQPFLVLEYVQGEHIDGYCRERELNVTQRIELCIQVLDAVAHAHSHLVVHRDIKPSNILIETQTGKPKLVDFGIAALMDVEGSALTREHGSGMSLDYAAPEQLRGEPVTMATDTYALGLVLFEILTGLHPFQETARTRLDRLARISDTLLRPSTAVASRALRRQLLGDLDRILVKALQPEPLDRYQTAQAFAEDLQRHLNHEPVRARPAAVHYRMRKFVLRHRISVGLVSLAITSLALFAVAAWRGMLEAQLQRDIATFEAARAEFQAQFAFRIMSEVGGDGQPITIRRLLDTGIDILENQYTDDPRFVIGMLVNVSGRYMDIGDTAGELAALDKAYRVALELGDSDQIAFVQCNTVETELAAGHLEAALARLQDGLENLAKVAAPSPARRIDCAMAQTRWLWSQGDLDAAINIARETAREIVEAGEETSGSYLTIGSMLGVMLREAGRLSEAWSWNEGVIDQLELTGRGQTLSMAAFLHNRASILYESGDWSGAFATQRALVDSIALTQSDAGVPPRHGRRYGLYQVGVEQNDDGLAWLDRSVKDSALQNNQRDQIYSLLDRAEALRLLERPEAALRDLAELEQLAHNNVFEHRYTLRGARLMRAQLKLERDPCGALEEVEALLHELGYPGQPLIAQLPEMLSTRALAMLALQRTDVATAARSALDAAIQAALDPTRSIRVQWAQELLSRIENRSTPPPAIAVSCAQGVAAIDTGA